MAYLSKSKGKAVISARYYSAKEDKWYDLGTIAKTECDASLVSGFIERLKNIHLHPKVLNAIRRFSSG